MKKLVVLFAAMMVMTGVAVADGPAWTYVDLGFTVGDSNDEEFTDGDTDGISLDGSWGKGLWHVGGSYGQLGFQDLDADVFKVMVGINPEITENTDMYVDVFFHNWDDSDAGFEADRTGLAWGIRSMITDNFELNGGMTYTDFDVDGDEGVTDVGFNFGMQYFFNESMGLGFTFDRFDFVDTDDYGTVDMARIYFRYSFGQK